MSKFTTEVRYVCESAAGWEDSEGFNKIETAINRSARFIFQDVIVSDEGVEIPNNYKFPIFDEHYRLPLEAKILRHYYTREICEETIGLWKLRLLNRMNEIMPYYNKLYESELLTFNPLYEVDYKRETNANKNEEGNNQKLRNENASGSSKSEGSDLSTAEREDTNWNLYSDTPQGGVNGIEGSGGIDSLNYLTNATKDTNESARNSSSVRENEVNSSTTRDDAEIGTHNIVTTDEYIEHVFGKMSTGVSYSKLLMEYRKSMLNIDKMIIDELSDLFFGLWA